MPFARALETSSGLELCETDDDNRDMAVLYHATQVPGTNSDAGSRVFRRADLEQ
jgi:hypothetical protein